MNSGIVLNGSDGETILTSNRPELVLLRQTHHVELRKVRMRVDFCDRAPRLRTVTYNGSGTLERAQVPRGK